MNLHIYAFLDHPVKRIRIQWVAEGETDSRKVIFARVKAAAKLEKSELIMFDGEIYRFDHGSGMFIKTSWDKLTWEEA